MKQQLRIIRISFLVCAALAVGAFWAGFYFGNTQPQTENLVTEGTTEIYTADAERTDSVTEEEKEDTVESMTALSPDKYYLKENGTYLAVYKGTSESVYFDTDLKLTDLPSDLQEEARTGIEFDNLEEVYGFLENYSS